jgi:hypothetical protein
MKKLKVWFDSFWGTFDKKDNFFVWVLSQTHDVEVTSENPDIIFTDSPNFQKNGNAKAVYFSGEPFFNSGACDYALTSFYVDSETHLRLPLYPLYAYDLWKFGITKSYKSILTRDYTKEILNEKSKLITYISQGAGGKCPREAIVNHFLTRMHVDCAGRHMNNHPVIPGEPGAITGSQAKIDFLRQYKFCFAIENNDEFNGYKGYTTEKIFEPMIANCIPIYWGSDLINDDFNSESFLNVKAFKDFDELADKVIEINNDKDLYIYYLMQPYVTYNKYFDMDYLVELFGKII